MQPFVAVVHQQSLLANGLFFPEWMLDGIWRLATDRELPLSRLRAALAG